MKNQNIKEARKTVRLFWEFLIWIVGILVSLAVGSGMINGTLTIPYLEGLAAFAGWVVVILTLLGLVLAIVDYFT